MNPEVRYAGGLAWERAIMGPRLTDKLIRRYEQRGFYSPEAKAARKEVRDKRQSKRTGSFTEKEGRMIFSPK